MIGKKLAHYEVLSLLGKGGMGEVYRARDTRLGRELALKILLAIAYVQRRQGEFESAVDKMVRAAEYSPQDANLCLHISETYSILRNWREAERWVRKAIIFAPDDVLSYVVAIWLATLEGDEARVEEVLEGMPAHLAPEGWSRCSVSAYHLGNYARSLEFAQKLPEIHDSQYYTICRPLRLAAIYRAMGRTQKAQEAFADAEARLGASLREDPDSSNLNAAYGIALAGLGRVQEGLEHVERSLELHPADKDVWIRSCRQYDLVHALILSGRLDEALVRSQS